MSIDRVRVANPKVWPMFTEAAARTQLTSCATAAALSRGNVTYYDSSAFGETLRIPCTDDTRRTFKDAEVLLHRLMNKKPHPHDSVIEHGSISFLFRCSRIATHEIVRHRLCTFTQQSTRYCEERGTVTFINPPDNAGFYATLNEAEYDISSVTMREKGWILPATESVLAYEKLRESGVKREAARYLLPHCLAAWIQITANFRQWRHMIRLRASPPAAPEMQCLFTDVKRWLSDVSPVLVEGL